jgi:23S rRNA (uracil1939-C5)-methyltransferase
MDEILEVEVEKLSFGGDGIARKDGLVYFIPRSAPGDLLQIRLTEKKKNFARAEIVDILKAGPSRIQAPCPYFGRCGGCTWQHISYEEQLKQKQAIVEEQLNKVLSRKIEVLPILPSPNPFRYRNRIQLKFDGKNLGFFARQSHNIIDIDDCLITEEVLAGEITTLKNELRAKNQAATPKIELLRTPQNKIERVFEDSPYEGIGFSQVNTRQNENLVHTVLNWMKPYRTSQIYDLYAGAGNFTFPLMTEFSQASFAAVELSEKSVQQGQNYVRSQNISPKKLKFYLSDVELYLKRTPLVEGSLVLLDPPRAGCSENVVRTLAVQKKIQKIFYISCNPAALARDLERFQKFGNWTPLRVQPFDMFPQTDHVETLVELGIDSL